MITLTAIIALLVFFAALFAVAVAYADCIIREGVPTEAERRFWPGDVVEDDGSYE